MINQQIKTVFGMLFMTFIFAHCCKEKIVTPDIPDDDYRLWSKGSCNRYFKNLDSAKSVKPIWVADYVRPTFISGDTLCRIHIFTHYLSGEPYEDLLFTNIPIKEKRFEIKDAYALNPELLTSSDYVRYKDISGVEVPYEVMEIDIKNKANHITFTKIDKSNNRIEGTFDVAYYSVMKKDTLYFRNGTFVMPYPIKI